VPPLVTAAAGRTRWRERPCRYVVAVGGIEPGKGLTVGFDTFGEAWEWGTPCHGWSAARTKDLTRYVLGVTPAEPGFTTVRVAPSGPCDAGLTMVTTRTTWTSA
jgi:hypothetical protein